MSTFGPILLQEPLVGGLGLAHANERIAIRASSHSAYTGVLLDTSRRRDRSEYRHVCRHAVGDADAEAPVADMRHIFSAAIDTAADSMGSPLPAGGWP